MHKSTNLSQILATENRTITAERFQNHGNAWDGQTTWKPLAQGTEESHRGRSGRCCPEVQVGPQPVLGAYRDNSAAVNRADPADGQGPASWPSSGFFPKPHVPCCWPLLGQSLEEHG